MSTFRNSPFPRRAQFTPDPDHLPRNSRTTPSRNPLSAARRALTPSFLRSTNNTSSSLFDHPETSRFLHPRPNTTTTTSASTLTHSFRTPERNHPRTPIAYRKFVPDEVATPTHPFDEDKISKTPAKDRNDEWLASLGFDLDLLKISAHRDGTEQEHQPQEENRNPNVIDHLSNLRPTGFAPKRSPPARLSVPARAFGSARASHKRAPLQPANAETSTRVTEEFPLSRVDAAFKLPALTQSSVPSVSAASEQPDDVEEYSLPPVYLPGETATSSAVYAETSISTDSYPDHAFTEYSSEALLADENKRNPQSSLPGQTVPQIASLSPASESSGARPSTPPRQATIATPTGSRRHTFMNYEASNLEDESEFCVPGGRQSSAMRDAPIGAPLGSRRHTDWCARTASKAVTDSTAPESMVTPVRLRSARKSMRTSARVSTRELRALVDAQESMGIIPDIDAHGPPGSTRKARARRSVAKVETAPGMKDPVTEKLATANYILSPVRATRQQKEVLGSERIVTPVRRSLRISRRHIPIVEINDVGEHNAERLESADYAFLPNRNLREKVDVDAKKPLM